MNLDKTGAQINTAINEQYDGNPVTNAGWNDIEGNIMAGRKLDGGGLAVVAVEMPSGSGVSFPLSKFNVGDIFYQNYQVHHGIIEDSDFRLHFHGCSNIDPTGKKVKFNVIIIYAGVGSKYAFGTGGASGTDVEIDIDSDDSLGNFLYQLVNTTNMNPTVSSLVKIRIERVAASADDLGTHYFLDFADAHVQINQERGSRTEFAK